MHTLNVLESGHQTVLQALDGLAEADWSMPGVCGDWSVKDIIAHLTSLEYVLVDVLSAYPNGDITPLVERWVEDTATFNDIEVTRYKHKSVAALLDEYQTAQSETIIRLIRIPEEKLRIRGALTWYDEGCTLEDFITYTFYGHKREHAAQIAAFRDQLQVQSHILSA